MDRVKDLLTGVAIIGGICGAALAVVVLVAVALFLVGGLVLVAVAYVLVTALGGLAALALLVDALAWVGSDYRKKRKTDVSGPSSNA